MSGMNNAVGYSLGLKKTTSGSGSASAIDSVARSSAAQAAANTNAITAQPSETIPDGGIVVTSEGVFQNDTGAPLTLDGTNPQTAASVQAAGMTPQASSANDPRVDLITGEPGESIPPGGQIMTDQGIMENATATAITLDATDPQTGASVQSAGLTPAATTPPETGTNWPVPAGAFTDSDNPTDAEALTWYTANVAASSTEDILYIGDIRWSVGDGDSGTPVLLRNALPESGGHVTQTLTAVATLTPSAKDDTLVRYYLDATGPLSAVDGEQRVVYPLPDAVENKEIELVRLSDAVPQINGTVNGDATGAFINEKNKVVTLLSLNGGGWALSV